MFSAWPRSPNSIRSRAAGAPAVRAEAKAAAKAAAGNLAEMAKGVLDRAARVHKVVRPDNQEHKPGRGAADSLAVARAEANSLLALLTRSTRAWQEADSRRRILLAKAREPEKRPLARAAPIPKPQPSSLRTPQSLLLPTHFFCRVPRARVLRLPDLAALVRPEAREDPAVLEDLAPTLTHWSPQRRVARRDLAPPAEAAHYSQGAADSAAQEALADPVVLEG